MIERVNPKHSDKLADRIAGAIVDLAYTKEENPKVAVETLIGHGNCYIIAESSVKFEFDEIRAIVARIAGSGMLVTFNQVQQDIHLANNQAKEIRCGDNGIFKGVPLTEEEKELSKIARDIYNKYPSDGKYILDGKKLIICQSNAIGNKLAEYYDNEGYFTTVNPLGDWTGGTDVDCGACIQEDSLVYTDAGLKPIKELKINDDVYTECGIANVTNVINKGHKKTKVIIDEYNGKIEATGDHPFRVFDGKQIVWKNCEDLKIGDILLKRKLNYINKVSKANKKNKVIKYPIYNNSGKHEQVCEKKIKVDRDFAYLMGWLIGDGNNTSDDRLVFYYGNTKEKAHLKPILEKVFGKEMVKEYPCQKDRFVILSKGLIKTLVNEGMSQSIAHNKVIPTFILEGNDAIKGAFISGLFDADGSVRKCLTKGRNIEHLDISLVTVSERLAQQVKTLLYSMGISSTISVRKIKENITINGKVVVESHVPYTLNIRGVESCKRFVQKCLFRIESKKQECLSLKFNRYCYDSDSYYLCTLVTDLLNKNTCKKNKYFPRHTSLIGRDGYKEQSIEYLLDMYAEYKDCEEYRTIKYIYDNLKMAKIKEIKESESTVYDITIDDESHSFVANDYIVHNCNRKLGSDMAQSVTGGGLHGKDLSKADVSVNIYAFLKAQELGCTVTACCAIGDKEVTFNVASNNEDVPNKETFKVPYSDIVEIARNYIKEIGGFEKFAEWGLF